MQLLVIIIIALALIIWGIATATEATEQENKAIEDLDNKRDIHFKN